MTSPRLAVLLAVALAAPAAARAEANIGLRAAYAIPGGDAYETPGFGSFKQSGLARGAVPLQLDATWRFSRAVSAGIYLAYGIGRTGSKLEQLCASPGSSCGTPRLVRYGVQGAWNFAPLDRYEPWLGLGAGVESAFFSVSAFDYGAAQGAPPGTATGDLKGTLRGWSTEASGGVDHRFGRVLAGPFLAFGVGQYTVQHVTIDGLGTVAGGGVDTAKTHQWFSLGVRGRFDL